MTTRMTNQESSHAQKLASIKSLLQAMTGMSVASAPSYPGMLPPAPVYQPPQAQMYTPYSYLFPQQSHTVQPSNQSPAPTAFATALSTVTPPASSTSSPPSPVSVVKKPAASGMSFDSSASHSARPSPAHMPMPTQAPVYTPYPSLFPQQHQLSSPQVTSASTLPVGLIDQTLRDATDIAIIDRISYKEIMS